MELQNIQKQLKPYNKALESQKNDNLCVSVVKTKNPFLYNDIQESLSLNQRTVSFVEKNLQEVEVELDNLLVNQFLSKLQNAARNLDIIEFTELLKLFVNFEDKKHFLDQLDASGYSILHYVAMSDHTEVAFSNAPSMIELLIDIGVDVNVRDSEYNEPPLLYAARAFLDYYHTFMATIDRENEVNIDQVCYFSVYIRLIIGLIKGDPDVFVKSCTNGNDYIADLAFQISKYIKSPHPKLIEYQEIILGLERINDYLWGRYLFLIPSLYKDTSNISPIYDIIYDEKILDRYKEDFLSGTKNINTQTDKGVTLLMMATMLGNTELVVRLLGEFHADTEIKDIMNFSAWDYANYYNNIPVMSLIDAYELAQKAVYIKTPPKKKNAKLNQKQRVLQSIQNKINADKKAQIAKDSIERKRLQAIEKQKNIENQKKQLEKMKIKEMSTSFINTTVERSNPTQLLKNQAQVILDRKKAKSLKKLTRKVIVANENKENYSFAKTSIQGIVQRDTDILSENEDIKSLLSAYEKARELQCVGKATTSVRNALKELDTFKATNIEHQNITIQAAENTLKWLFGGNKQTTRGTHHNQHIPDGGITLQRYKGEDRIGPDTKKQLSDIIINKLNLLIRENRK